MKSFLLLLLFLIISSCSAAQNIYPKREVRGAWIASVGNIDWPLNPGEDSGKQQSDLREIVRKLYYAGINTIYFQVRTECDALYNSSYEPWSYWLTGTQGKIPAPYFDPLKTIIDEAHFYGIELHAWFNPYRAVRNISSYSPAPNHVSVTRPEWILTFGKYKMLDPGLPEVRDYIASVVTDVLKKYDVDGVHFDDYFYPFEPKITFQDRSTFTKYNRGISSIDDWRRDNINLLISQVHDSISSFKPYIKFGVSPFGIVENRFAGTKGFESYNILYCDPLSWIKNKLIDYIVPQLYWEIGNKTADYKALLSWWASASDGVHLYSGLFSSKFSGQDWPDKNEISRQIRLNRNTADVKGSVFFSSKTITRPEYNLADTLKNEFYRYPALLPVMQWKDSIPPLPPVNLSAVKDSNGVSLYWLKPAAAKDGDKPVKYIVYKFSSPDEININDAEHIIAITQNIAYFRDENLPLPGMEAIYLVTSVDRLQNESSAVIAVIQK